MGETFDVEISLKNNPGIISAMLKLEYNNTYLELTNISDKGELGASVFGNNKLAIPYKMNWNDDAGYENITYNGTIATLTFRIKDDTPIGTYPIIISYDYGEIYNVDLAPVDFNVKNSSVVVLDYISGDVNGDQTVNSIDRTILARYLTGWDGYTDASISYEAADLNGDGNVTSLDRTILARHLTGWDGYEILPIK